MNYDSWKTGGGIDPRIEALQERCSDIESQIDGKLSEAAAEFNHNFDGIWEVEPALADCDESGAITLEVSLRLIGLPVTGSPGDLQEVAQALIKLGEALSPAAQADRTRLGLRLAPSIHHPDQPKSELG